MNRHGCLFLVASLFLSLTAAATTAIKILPRPSFHSAWTADEVKSVVTDAVDVNTYREVRVQIFPDHMVLQLFSKLFHRVDLVRLDMSTDHEVIAAHSPYVYTTAELKLQDDRNIPSCPDPSVQFLAFAPNNIPVEQEVTLDVIQAAQAKGYKVVSLLNAQATRLNYLAYMSCPQLVGNFYDGDASPQHFNTYDGIVSATEISAAKSLFRYQVTNIWVACEAFNDPMLTAVTVDAQSQKYAAGINNLLVGPSDYAAACAMKAAIDGAPMTQSFQDCYKQLDTTEDQWGFGGTGSDIFASSHHSL
jgi:hypothetical protein